MATMTEEFAVTNTHLENARVYGAHRAQREKDMGLTSPTDNIWEAIDPNDVLFLITGEKCLLEGDHEEPGWEILDVIERAYFDEWDEE